MNTPTDPVSIESLSHVALNVTNMEASAAFYREVLGFQQLYARTDVGAAASTGFLTPSGVMVELLQFVNEDGSPVKVDASRDTVRLAFSVADMDEAKTALTASGAQIVHSMEFEGIQMIFLTDPDGRVLEIAQFPGGVVNAADLHDH